MDKESGQNPSLPVKKSFIKRYLPDEKPIAEMVVVAVLLIGAIAWISYKPKLKTDLRSVNIAGVQITNKAKADAQKLLKDAAAAQKINIVINDKTFTYSDKDLGVKRDASSLLDATYSLPDSIIARKLVDKPQTPKLNTYVQKSKLIAAIDSRLGNDKTTIDASVTVDGGSLNINPGQAGLNIDYDQLIQQISKTDLSQTINLTAKFTQQQPAIPTSAAQTAKDQANALITPSYGVSSDSNGTRYASLAQKASWLVFTPDQAKHTITPAINIVAARSTMSRIAQGFAQSPKNRVTLTDTDGSTTVLDDGQPGLSVDQQSINDGLNQLSSAIPGHQSFTFSVKVAVQPQDDRNLGTSTGGKFVLVDVANYKAYAIDNTTVDRTMVVSTGRPGLETPKGHFNILSKTRLVTMTGCNKLVGCWTVPNVPNAEFFTKDGDALHGTYWYVNWGHQNASHGCVNLQLADAAWLYDWTEVGTDVVVV